MLFNWFAKPPLLEEESAHWLLQTFAWCMEHFDADFFHRQTQLIFPSNRHFPGRAHSPHGMAELVFERVAHYAGMEHWPWMLVEPGVCVLEPGVCVLEAPARVQVEGPLRGDGLPAIAAADSPRLPIQYDPKQINNPEALIATYAHTLAYYLGSTARQPPPGDAGHWPYATEVLAIFMGFGLMFANSAFTFRGGCGSCQSVGRAAYLSEFESAYTLALFCVLKQIPPQPVARHLKKHLRGFFKRAMQEIPPRLGEFPRLTSQGA